jgi:hypothetical protein
MDGKKWCNFFKSYASSGYVFRNDLRGKLDSRAHELHEGLSTYLALVGQVEFEQCNADIWHLAGGAEDPKREAVIRPMLAAVGSAAVSAWEDLRGKMSKLLKDGPIIDVYEASDADAAIYSRCAWAKITVRTIYANPRDMTTFTIDPSSAAATVGPSFDGFWQLIHETMHIIYNIIDDSPGDATRPGPIEDRLNLLRSAFNLPLRTSYYNPSTKKKGIQFDGGDVIWP